MDHCDTLGKSHIGRGQERSSLLILLSIPSGDGAVDSNLTSHCQRYYVIFIVCVAAAIVIGGGTLVLLCFLIHRNPQWLNFGVVVDNGGDGGGGDGDGDGDEHPGQDASIPQAVARFRVHHLNRATNHFNGENKLGRSGRVFRGTLRGGRQVIVKRFRLGARSITVNVKRMNVVKLFGYALDDHARYMVYEDIKEGTTLSAILFGSSEGKPTLTWSQKLVIALDMARALSYLHGLSGDNYVHGDLKPSNILVTQEGMRAKVAGYALVESEPDGNSSVRSRYLAPEYEATGHANAQMDVYAFGVILVELCIGKPECAGELLGEGHNFRFWTKVIPMMSHTGTDAADQTSDAANIWNVLKLAYCCTGDPSKRPAMETMATLLQPLVVEWIPPTDAEISSDEAELGQGILSERMERLMNSQFTYSSSSS